MISPRRRFLRPALAGAAALALAACATQRLEPDFGAFSDAYANNMNWQMLLNLARLDQGHPAYFMAIGEIRLARSQSASVQDTTTRSRTEGQTIANNISNTVTNVLSGNLVGNAQTSASPTFVFIPVNSEETARQLLAPISIDVFNTLFQQGWPVDQLLRVLVERIEVRFDDPARKPIVIVNSPTRGSAESFAQFLRACDVVRRLQQSGGLSLVSDEQFKAVAPVELDGSRLTVRDLADAADRGRSWQRTPGGGYQLGTTRTVYRFQADPRTLLDTLRALGLEPPDPTRAPPAPALDPEAALYQEPLRRRELENMLAVFSAGLQVVSPTASPDAASSGTRGGAAGAGGRAGGSAGADDEGDAAGEAAPAGRGRGAGAGASARPMAAAADGAGAGESASAAGTARRSGVSTVLILRSFRNILEAVAYEQRAFHELAGETDFLSGVPARQRRPILTTDWTADKTRTERPVISLNFGDRSYAITDPAGVPATSLESRWNRDVFRLLVNLSSQVTVDITKFQRQVLELTQ